MATRTMPTGTVEWRGTYFRLYVDYNDSNPRRWAVTAVRWTNDTPKDVRVQIIDQVDGSVYAERIIPAGEHSQLASVPSNWSVHSYVDPTDGQTYVDFGNFGLMMGTV